MDYKFFYVSVGSRKEWKNFDKIGDVYDYLASRGIQTMDAVCAKKQTFVLKFRGFPLAVREWYYKASDSSYVIWAVSLLLHEQSLA